MTSWSVIYCEGFTDRDFISGWLTTSRGWLRPTPKPSVVNPITGKTVTGGVYGFEKQGSFVEVHQANGYPRILELIATRLRTIVTEHIPSRHFVVVVDLDDRELNDRLDAISDRVVHAGGSRVADDHWTLGETVVRAIVMHARSSTSESITRNQCLDRIVTAAVTEAYEARAAAVTTWLAERPDGVEDDKAQTWSWMAGWWPDAGCTEFFRRIWDDPPIRKRLEHYLEETGATAVLAHIEG